MLNEAQMLVPKHGDFALFKESVHISTLDRVNKLNICKIEVWTFDTSASCNITEELQNIELHMITPFIHLIGVLTV